MTFFKKLNEFEVPEPPFWEKSTNFLENKHLITMIQDQTIKIIQYVQIEETSIKKFYNHVK